MQQKANFFSDNADIQFQISRRVDFEVLFSGLTAAERDACGCSTPEEYKQLCIQMMDGLGAVCGSELAPNAAKVEKEPIYLQNGEVVLPPTIVHNVQKLLEVGSASLGCAPEYGGMGVPFFWEAMANELLHRACPSTGLNVGWYSSIAHILEKFANDAIKEAVIPRLASGEWSGSMALTEPDAGSDLAALRAYGEKQADDTWKLYGTKRFITNGNGQVALVLAMNGKGKTGLNNLSLYICLRKNADGSDNFRIAKIEEKLGLHGSATCELNFDGATAQLLGENGKGFQAMLHLMNDARIAVGFQGLGYMEAILRLTTDYCNQRHTWGKPIAKHELLAERLLDLEVDVRALRSLCYQAAYCHTVAAHGERRLKAEPDMPEVERSVLEKRTLKAKRRLRRWTPLIKWYGSEKAVEWARNGLQMHGGYGFTTEYRAEWWARESLILPLYEGTSQIQSMMVVKDTMKNVIRNPRRFVEKALGLKMQTLRAGDPLRKKLYRAQQLESAAILAILVKLFKVNVRTSISANKSADILRMVKLLSRDLVKMENVGPALLAAERLCEIKAITSLAQCLVWDAEEEPSRRIYAERFLNRTWPRLEMLKAEIELEDPALMSRLSWGVPGTSTGGAQEDTAAVT